MNYHYTVVLFAFLLAQLLMTSIQVYDYQKEKSITWMAALIAYLKAEVGYFVIGFIGILCICFLLSDIIDLKVTRQDLLSAEKLNWKQNLQLYFKVTSFVIGGFIQYIAFTYKKRGKVAIDKAADKFL